MTMKKAAWRGGVAQHISDTNYTRRNYWPHQPIKALSARIEACLKSSIIWFPTHGLMPFVVADWLIRFFRLEAS